MDIDGHSQKLFLACVLVFPCLDPQGVLKVTEVSLSMPALVRSIFLRNT